MPRFSGKPQRLIAAGLLILATGSSLSVTPAAGVTRHKLLVIIEENHSQAQALSQMPYLASLANRYGRATAYAGVAHPSLPNYLAIGGGSTYGVTDDKGPTAHPISGPSVFGQTLALGLTAKTYAESMPGNCKIPGGTTYAIRHNEWTYFTKERAACDANDVPLGTLSAGALRDDARLGHLPVTGQITPNVCNDGHDCSLATADTWLKGWMARLLAGPDYTSGNLTIIVTFDEDDRVSGNNVAFVVVDPRLSGRVVTLPATHYSLTRWYEDNAGAAHLNNAAAARDLKVAFGL